MALITKMRRWIYGGRQLKVQLVGSDEAGKSELLVYLYQNGIIPPTKKPWELIAYEGVPVEYPRGWELRLYNTWDSGSPYGRGYIAFNLMTPDTLVWFLHDCTEDVFSIEDYIHVMRSKGAKYMWVLLNKQDLLSPEDRDATVAEHRRKLESILVRYARPAGITWFIVDEPGFSSKTGDFVLPFVKNVTQTITQLDRAQGTRFDKDRDASLLGKPSDQELRKRIEQSYIRDSDDFWPVFMSGEMMSWDHLEFLQAGYLVLIQSLEQGEGLLKCAATLLEHLTRLHEARPDVFQASGHFTKAAFWIVQLRIAAFKFQYEVNDGTSPSREDFRPVLLHTPSLLFDKLWAYHYSEKVINGSDARTSFVMPDLQPFPQVTRPLLTALADGKDDLLDEDEDVEAQQDLVVGPERLPRWALGLMQTVMANDLRRGKALQEAMVGLQADTVRLRSRYPELAQSGDVPPYSETQAYFWAQVVHLHLWILSHGSEKKGATMSPEEVNSLTFEKFKELCSVDGSEWKEYYSPEVWGSVEARLEFVNPDKKALPNLVEVH